MTQSVFVEKLLQMTKYSDDLNPVLFPNTKKEFIGQIEYNQFSILRNTSAFFRDNFILIANINENDEGEIVEGSIKGHKFSPFFVFSFTLICILFLIYNLLFNSEASNSITASLIFSAIGLIKSTGLIYRLQDFKKQFEKMIEK